MDAARRAGLEELERLPLRHNLAAMFTK